MSYAYSQVLNLAINQTALGKGPALEVAQANRTFQAVVTGQGLQSATVLIEGSLNGVDYVTLKTLTCVATDAKSVDTDAINEAWKYTRANTTALSAGSTLNVYMGV